MKSSPMISIVVSLFCHRYQYVLNTKEPKCKTKFPLVSNLRYGQRYGNIRIYRVYIRIFYVFLKAETQLNINHRVVWFG